MAKLLLEKGADITIMDKYGGRPYTAALDNKNQEMDDFIADPGRYLNGIVAGEFDES